MKESGRIRAAVAAIAALLGALVILAQQQSALATRGITIDSIMEALALTPRALLPLVSNGPTRVPSATPTVTLTPVFTPTPVASPTPTSTPNPGMIVRVSGGVTYTRLLKDGFEMVQVDGPGQIVTLPQIANAIGDAPTVIGPFLINEGGGVWKLNGALRMHRDVTLVMDSSTVTWLKIRSDSTPANFVDRGSFGFVDTIDGNVLIDGIKITSWDIVTNDVDRVYKNGRAFLRVEGRSRMDIKNSEVAYLGNPEGSGSYGISWRDETLDTGGNLIAGTTGDVINTDFHHNYYGFFSYAASNMTIRNNKFRNNDSYGFDPHDFSFNFVVEDNEAYDNGNHGFIISRGCYNFVFRRNKAYRNVYTVIPGGPNRAHGFMIDPGGLESDGGPYTPSFSNTLEFNEAWDNQGYGLRLLDAYSNTVRNNVFRGNLRGITIERGSRGNLIENNTIIGDFFVPKKADYGIQVVGNAQQGHPDNNIIRNNTLTGFREDAILVADASSNTQVIGNVMSEARSGIRMSENSILNTWSQNQIYSITNGLSPNSAIRVSGPTISPTTPVPNFGISPPLSLTVSGLTLSGVADPNAIVEVFTGNDNNETRYYEGQTTADAAGNFTITVAAWRGPAITAIQTNPSKGSSDTASYITRPPP